MHQQKDFVDHFTKQSVESSSIVLSTNNTYPTMEPSFGDNKKDSHVNNFDTTNDVIELYMNAQELDLFT